jgi:predicted membrane protein
MLWNKTTKYRPANWTDTGIALGTISGAFLGIVSGIMIFANLFLGLFICLIIFISIGAFIGAVLDWLQKSRGKTKEKLIEASRVNTHRQAVSHVNSNEIKNKEKETSVRNRERIKKRYDSMKTIVLTGLNLMNVNR